jgi:hypothetical protein
MISRVPLSALIFIRRQHKIRDLAALDGDQNTPLTVSDENADCE